LRGLAPAEKQQIERLVRRRLPPSKIVSNDLARELAALSQALNRRLGLLIDRAGRVEAISVGDAINVEVPRQPSAPSGRMRFCTLRFITTRFVDEELPPDELSPLALHRLDALAVIHVQPNGEPGRVRVAHLLPAPEPSRRSKKRGSKKQEETRARGQWVPRPPAVSRREEEAKVQDIAEDGERYRLLPPRPASLLDDDFLELIRALEQEFDRHFDRTKRADRVGRAILVHVTTGSRAQAEESMDELAELAASSDLEVVERVVQRRPRFDPRTMVGAGKLRDLIIHALRLQADFIVVDQNLTPAQARNIAEATDIKVIDRSQLILDLFARRARTREGKVQVELAQLKYLLPRLMSRGENGLSRLEGGVGGRGPGEQKLEIDRRRVRDRIRALEKQLVAERRRREQRRSRRRERRVPVVSLVGYTNAGKSTLLNLLTRSEVFVEAKMFATLDPTSRRLRLPREREIVLNDTVGFIRDLPKDLVAAFRATLEEIEDSDLVLHVVDISHPGYNAQIAAVQRILTDLEYDRIPQLLVLNKVDRLSRDERLERLGPLEGMSISALKRQGIQELLQRVDSMLPIREGFPGIYPLDDGAGSATAES
jgi:GTP-binding protein HflX